MAKGESGFSGNRGGKDWSKSFPEFTGTEKQVNYAKDLMQKVNEAIDATEKELIADRLKFPRNTEKIFGSEKEMRKAYEEAVSIAKEYYARKAYQYLDGNAGNFLSNRWMFPVGKPVSNSNNIRSIIDHTAREIAHGGSEDGCF